MGEFTFVSRRDRELDNVEIRMQDCHALGCISTLKHWEKEHLAKKKKESPEKHICGTRCQNTMRRIHAEKHDWYNKKDK